MFTRGNSFEKSRDRGRHGFENTLKASVFRENFRSTMASFMNPLISLKLIRYNKQTLDSVHSGRKNHPIDLSHQSRVLFSQVPENVFDRQNHKTGKGLQINNIVTFCRIRGGGPDNGGSNYENKMDPNSQSNERAPPPPPPPISGTYSVTNQQQGAPINSETNPLDSKYMGQNQVQNHHLPNISSPNHLHHDQSLGNQHHVYPTSQSYSYDQDQQQQQQHQQHFQPNNSNAIMSPPESHNYMRSSKPVPNPFESQYRATPHPFSFSEEVANEQTNKAMETAQQYPPKSSINQHIHPTQSSAIKHPPPPSLPLTPQDNTATQQPPPIPENIHSDPAYVNLSNQTIPSHEASPSTTSSYISNEFLPSPSPSFQTNDIMPLPPPPPPPPPPPCSDWETNEQSTKNLNNEKNIENDENGLEAENLNDSNTNDLNTPLHTQSQNEDDEAMNKDPTESLIDLELDKSNLINKTKSDNGTSALPLIEQTKEINEQENELRMEEESNQKDPDHLFTVINSQENVSILEYNPESMEHTYSQNKPDTPSSNSIIIMENSNKAKDPVEVEEYDDIEYDDDYDAEDTPNPSAEPRLRSTPFLDFVTDVDDSSPFEIDDESFESLLTKVSSQYDENLYDTSELIEKKPLFAEDLEVDSGESSEEIYDEGFDYIVEDQQSDSDLYLDESDDANENMTLMKSDLNESNINCDKSYTEPISKINDNIIRDKKNDWGSKAMGTRNIQEEDLKKQSSASLNKHVQLSKESSEDDVELLENDAIGYKGVEVGPDQSANDKMKEIGSVPDSSVSNGGSITAEQNLLAELEKTKIFDNSKEKSTISDSIIESQIPTLRDEIETMFSETDEDYSSLEDDEIEALMDASLFSDGADQEYDDILDEDTIDIIKMSDSIASNSDSESLQDKPDENILLTDEIQSEEDYDDEELDQVDVQILDECNIFQETEYDSQHSDELTDVFSDENDDDFTEDLVLNQDNSIIDDTEVYEDESEEEETFDLGESAVADDVMSLETLREHLTVESQQNVRPPLSNNPHVLYANENLNESAHPATYHKGTHELPNTEHLPRPIMAYSESQGTNNRFAMDRNSENKSNRIHLADDTINNAQSFHGKGKDYVNAKINVNHQTITVKQSGMWGIVRSDSAEYQKSLSSKDFPPPPPPPPPDPNL